MTTRIVVSSKVEDARARSILHTLKSLFPKAPLKDVATSAVYTIDARLTPKELKRAAERLANPVTEEFSIESTPRTVLKGFQGRSLTMFASNRFSFVLEIGYLPGVTDNVGHTVQETVEDCTGRKFREGEAVYSSVVIYLEGALERHDVENFARELHNPLIERATVFSRSEVAKYGIPVTLPKVTLGRPSEIDEVNLQIPDSELIQLGKDGITNKDGSRRGPLALSLRALHIIRDHFRTKGRNPTDVELESLAQTWSEHCKHNIFGDPLDDIKEGIFRRYIKGATEKIRHQASGNRTFVFRCLRIIPAPLFLTTSIW